MTVVTPTPLITLAERRNYDRVYKKGNVELKDIVNLDPNIDFNALRATIISVKPLTAQFKKHKMLKKIAKFFALDKIKNKK